MATSQPKDFSLKLFSKALFQRKSVLVNESFEGIISYQSHLWCCSEFEVKQFVSKIPQGEIKRGLYGYWQRVDKHTDGKEGVDACSCQTFLPELNQTCLSATKSIGEDSVTISRSEFDYGPRTDKIQNDSLEERRLTC